MQNSFNNRSFKFGDGFFETLTVRNGVIFFLDYHFDRIKKSFTTLALELPDDFSRTWLNNAIIKELNSIVNADLSNWRVRITFWRKGVGFYTPVQNETDYYIETMTLNESNFSLNPKGLSLGICEDIFIAPDSISAVKSTSALHYVMAAIQKEKKAVDDCLLLNCYNQIAESSSSNIFIVRSGKLYTVPLSEGCIDGVCRRVIISLAKRNNVEVVEMPLKIIDLETADEIWLTNVVNGIRWVRDLTLFSEKRYRNKMAGIFTELLNQYSNH